MQPYLLFILPRIKWLLISKHDSSWRSRTLLPCNLTLLFNPHSVKWFGGSKHDLLWLSGMLVTCNLALLFVLPRIKWLVWHGMDALAQLSSCWRKSCGQEAMLWWQLLTGLE